MENAPPISDSGSKPTQTSIWSRLLNVFAAPGDVFEEVKYSPPTAANWLAPTLILAFVGTVSAFVIFSQPAIVQQIHEQQQKAFDQQVGAGKMTQAQADQAMAMADKFFGSSALKAFGAVGAVFGSFIRLFWWAFILWLLSLLFLKAKIPFLKVTEVAGLATMISVLGAVVTVLMTVIFGKLGATPSLALAVGNFDYKNKIHLLLGAANIFSFWQIGVFACGLARLAGAPFTKTLLAVALYWIAVTLLFIFIGFGQMAM
jgi:hypothetical protein